MGDFVGQKHGGEKSIQPGTAKRNGTLVQRHVGNIGEINKTGTALSKVTRDWGYGKTVDGQRRPEFAVVRQDLAGAPRDLTALSRVSRCRVCLHTIGPTL